MAKPVRDAGGVELPKIACLCPTFNRPHLLPHALESFLRQDYPADRCELIILDDAGQYETQSQQAPKPWTLISFDRRFRTMGEKRNATAALASRDVDAFALWDDDDIYLPWTLRAHAAAMAKANWSRPSAIFKDRPQGLVRKGITSLYHATWAFTRNIFAEVKGYPFWQSGQDKGLRNVFEACGFDHCDPLSLGFEPYFIYRWASVDTKHLSANRGDGGYYRLADYMRPPHAGPISPCWPKEYDKMAMEATQG